MKTTASVKKKKGIKVIRDYEQQNKNVHLEKSLKMQSDKPVSWKYFQNKDDPIEI